MTSPLPPLSRMAVCTIFTGLAWFGTAPAQSPTVFNACITALTGVYYEPRQPGTCFHSTHRPVSWTDGAGALRSGSTAGGDLGGTYPNPFVAALRGHPIADVAPTTNQVLTWDGAAWTPANPSGGTSGAAGGDLTGTYPNPTIAADAVNSSKIADNTIDDADVVDGGLDASSLATGAVGSEEVLDGSITTADVNDNSLTADDLASQAVGTDELAPNAVTGEKVANGNLVRSVNGLTEAVTLAAGSGVSIAPSGQTLTISTTGGAGGTTGQNALSSYGTGLITVSSTTFANVPGLSRTITVPENSKVIVATDGGIQTNSGSTAGFSIVDVAIFVDGVIPPDGGFRRVVAANTDGIVNTLAGWAIQQVLELAAGTHTIQVRAALSPPINASATVSGNNASALQGALNVAIIKL